MLEFLLATLLSVTDRPADHRVTLDSAYAALHHGDLTRARTAFRKVLAEGDGGPAALAELFYLDRRLHRDSEAIEVGRRYVRLRPDDDRFRLDLAYALEATKGSEADALFFKLASSPDRLVAKAASEQLRARRTGTQRQDPLLTSAYRKLKKGDRAGALADFQRHVAAHPKDAVALLELCYVQAAAGDHAGSLESLDRYLSLRPGDEKAELQRAYDLQAAGRTAEALEVLAKLGESRDARVSEQARNALAQAAGTDPLLLSAHQRLQSGDRVGAVADMRQHLARFANDSPSWLNLAFAQAGNGDSSASLQSVDQYLILEPGDPKGELQEAYDLDALGRHEAARTIYRSLAMAADPSVSTQARQQLNSLNQDKPFSTTAEMSLEYDSRFKDAFYGGDSFARSNGPELQPYAVFRFSNDTRSTAGPVPTIYNDNAAIVGLGLRKAVAPGAFLYAEGGGHFGFSGNGSSPALRVGLDYYHVFGPLQGSNTALDFDVSHYSYYAGDTIAYGSLLHMAPIAKRFGLVFGSNLGLDAQNRYYNNFAEGVAGVELSLSSFRLRLSEVYGTYLRGSGMPASRSYWSTRPMIVYDVRF